MNFADTHAGVISTPAQRAGNRSQTRAQVVATLCLALGLPALADAAESPALAPVPDKSQYNLFHPVPTDLLREMSTDRPDKTESPYTVDAGHFQIEMDLINYAYDHETGGGADLRTDAWSAAPFNLKAGLLNQVDLQILFEPYAHARVNDRVTGITATQSGIGDLTTRLKVNLWGNDGGTTAFAVMPFVTFPTHQYDFGERAVAGGIIFPLAVALPRDWSMGLMTELDLVPDLSGNDHHAEFINSITFSHPICGPLNGYVEFFSVVGPETDFDWVGTVDFGFTYALTENFQLDAGLNIGVTATAPDLNPFVGLAFRF